MPNFSMLEAALIKDHVVEDMLAIDGVEAVGIGHESEESDNYVLHVFTSKELDDDTLPKTVATTGIDNVPADKEIQVKVFLSGEFYAHTTPSADHIQYRRPVASGYSIGRGASNSSGTAGASFGFTGVKGNPEAIPVLFTNAHLALYQSDKEAT